MKTVLVDCDEVLVSMAPHWFKWLKSNSSDVSQTDLAFCEDRYDMGYLFEPYMNEDINPFDFWFSDDLYDQAVPISGAVEGMEKLKQAGFEIIVVTYCIGNHFGSKERFLWKYFGEQIEGVIATKLKHKIKGDLLIDDRLDNLVQCDNETCKILYQTRYNQFVKGHPDVVMNSWDDIDKVLEIF